MRIIAPIVLFASLIIFQTGCNQPSTQTQPQLTKEESFSNFKLKYLETLDSITIIQKNKLVLYLETIRSLAKQASNDPVLKSYFKQQIAFEAIPNKEALPQEVLNKSKSVESGLITHYINNYNQFYDLLMINREGKVIYTVRKEADFKQNIFDKKFDNTLLSKKLYKANNESFVDFQFYEISNEPSAFFIEPIIENNNLAGWFVLQFSITKINSIFDRSEQLGETGEVILVNKKHYMLTDSRFSPESTILKQQLANKNISEKFKLKQGHKTVTDYRGYKVISSFKVFNFWNSEWLIIAKINQAELLTNYFKNNKNALFHCLETAIKDRTFKYSEKYNNTPTLEVNIDEFKRIEKSEIILTKGLSTCTGLLISMPNQFAYLAHISPYDKLYNETKTDIIGQLMQRIDYLEITKAEKQLLNFVAVTPNIAIAKSITKRLIKEGIFLNQIKLITKNEMRSASIYYQCGKKDAVIGLQPHNQKDPIKYLNTSIIPTLDNEICLEK